MHSPGDDTYAQLSDSISAQLSPEIQQRLKTLIYQLRGALHRHQLSPDVETEIHHLVGDLDILGNPQLLSDLIKTALAKDQLSPEIQQEISHLLHQHIASHRAEALLRQVRQTMDKQLLPGSVQGELSQLLTLLTYLDQSPELIDEFELAIAALMPTETAQPPNLRLARHLRRHIAAHLQQSPNPLWSIMSASGSSHNRLLSGLSWFLIVFTLLPSLLLSGFFVSSVTQQHREIQQLREDLDTYQQRLANASQQVGQMTERIGAANQRLGTINLDPLMSDQADVETGSLSLLAQQEAAVQQIEGTLTASEATLRSLQNQTLPQLQQTLDGARADGIENPQAFLRTVQQQVNRTQQQLNQVQEQLIIRDPVSEQLTPLLIKAQIADLRAAFAEVNTTIATAQSLLSEALLADAGDPVVVEAIVPAVDAEEVNNFGDLAIVFINGFLTNLNTLDLPLMLAVVATGALGSFVSVIVRANEFIDRKQIGQMDLFLVGFFRPIVGMAFAFFLVAILESGIFSSVLSINSVKPDKKIYLYIAIAFVAGFSERLVKDLVGQTSDMLGVRGNSEDSLR
ncbi:hypothetical protein C7271_16170 [filamentous cyanobacterium CCP5]|nr:hypothetical protein C7271_16170 [filamentous cyanobacterium CCP5]